MKMSGPAFNPIQRLELASMALRQNSPADLLGFLDDHLKTREDLLKLPSLVARIDRECLDLEAGLLSLEKNLSCALVSWISRSDEVREVLRQIDLSRGVGFVPL